MSQNVMWSPIGGVYPSILAIGDSWFWYPLPGGSLINHLGSLVESREHVVLALGYNGAESVDYTVGKYRKTIRTALKHHGKSLSAVFISGGGNDFAGFNDLRPMLAADCSAAKSASACFRDGDSNGTLGWTMHRLAESYRILIEQVVDYCTPRTKVILHTYDYALPSGIGLFGDESKLLLPALIDANVPVALRAACVKHVIDRLTEELNELRSFDTKRIVLVDSRGCLDADEWANEIHPKPAGFKRIAEERWHPVLRDLGLAK